jgi:hypothetical protein
MPKHIMMMWVAGGATLLAASLAYVSSRPSVAPVLARAQAGWARLRRKVPRAAFRGMCRKDRGEVANSAESALRNKPFAAYRTAELARLEDEEREFRSYLDRLRGARDKAEFETFMAERRVAR